jgi:peptide/nickel transport system permease protein
MRARDHILRMATDPYAEPSRLGGTGGMAHEPGIPEVSQPGIEGKSPTYLAYRRLRRNKVALAFGALFVAIVLFCLAAPLWANHVAHPGPDDEHLTEKITINGQPTNVVSPMGIPIGPGLHSKFLLGADQSGRDVMVRLMYGGRTSLFIGVMSAVVTTLLGVGLGLIAGYRRGWADAVISRSLDVIWAFPVLLLGIALGTALATSGSGLNLGPISIAPDSLWIPILIIGFVYAPYMARPIRGEVLALREKEFVEAAIAQGKGATRIMFSELLPNLWSTIIVFFTLNIANNMLLEAALSFLGAGVQPPKSSWGSLVSDGFEVIYSSPHLVLIPGIMILLTVLSLNVFGDGLRDALDPRAKIRLEAAAIEDTVP